jgi:predicted  nucleic acid-binding Zn-ribbon protein
MAGENGEPNGRVKDPWNWAFTAGGLIGAFFAAYQTNTQSDQRANDTNTKVERLQERIEADERAIVDYKEDIRRELNGDASKEAIMEIERRLTAIEVEEHELEAVLRPLVRKGGP